MSVAASSPVPMEVDSRASLSHVLSGGGDNADERGNSTDRDLKTSHDTKDDADTAKMPHDANTREQTPASQIDVAATSFGSGKAKNMGNGSVSSVYSGNKIRHLKKDDGVPLWRKDIQYEFLRYVFEDDKGVFTKYSDGAENCTFADIYLDAMARSTKCSKILKDKLLSERPAALNMAMVCLLVNVGRMNTTLNFFPEMRAQLRTYHSIPALQAHQDKNAYKQLQDAPRLKSILKGATEGLDLPTTLEDIKYSNKPRTNAVSLVFVLAQQALHVSELHFYPPRDFFDLITRSALSSKSRARAFLWLMWWYLESNFSKEAALNNPFGPGQHENTNEPVGVPIKVPEFTFLTDEQAEAENVDTPAELEFGEQKRLDRLAILANESQPASTGKRGRGKAVASLAMSDDDNSPAPRGGKGRGRGTPSYHDHGGYDSDRTRSMSPPSIRPYNSTGKGLRIKNSIFSEGGASSTKSTPSGKPPGPGRGNWRRNRKPDGTVDTSAARSSKARHSDRGPTSALAQSHDLLSSPITGPGSGAAGLIAPFNHNPANNIDSSSHFPTQAVHGYYIPLSGPVDPPSHSSRKPRPQTAHQMRVERYRKMRVDYVLDRKLRGMYERSARRRASDGSILRAWRRAAILPDGYDSSEDGPSPVAETMRIISGADMDLLNSLSGVGGLVPMVGAPETEDREDWGEEVDSLSRALRRVGRRLERWEGDGTHGIRKGRHVPGAIPEPGPDDNDIIPDDRDDEPLPAPPPAAAVSTSRRASTRGGRRSTGGVPGRKPRGGRTAGGRESTGRRGGRTSAAASSSKAKTSNKNAPERGTKRKYTKSGLHSKFQASGKPSTKSRGNPIDVEDRTPEPGWEEWGTAAHPAAREMRDEDRAERIARDEDLDADPPVDVDGGEDWDEEEEDPGTDPEDGDGLDGAEGGEAPDGAGQDQEEGSDSEMDMDGMR